MISVLSSSIIPVCLLLLLGFALKHWKFVPESFFAHANRLGFWILLPSMLFCSILQSSRETSSAGIKIALLLCVCSLVVTLLAWLVTKVMQLPDGSARALMQAAMRGNLAYTGYPVVLFAFGESSPVTVAASFALVATIPFYNFWAVIILSRSDQPGGKHGNHLATLLTILRNPLIVGCVMGMLLHYTGVVLPKGIFNAVNVLGSAALPCALLSLGAGLNLEYLRSSMGAALAGTFLKLIAMPLAGWGIARLTGVKGEMLLVLLLFLATPSAVSSYVMADQMGADRDLAGATVSLSTLLCLPVMALVILLIL